LKNINVQVLDHDRFQKYGQYASVINPVTPYIGFGEIRFFRDIITLGSGPISVSNTVVEPMPFVVETMEYHTATAESFMMLDGDAVICLGIATTDGKLPEKLEAFHVPLGVLVHLNAGVWHYAPFPVKNKQLNSIVFLPERTYTIDCTCIELSENEKYKLNL